jgi:lipoprotein-anchoring transpeptidase ErfK/SrfK
MRIWLTSIVVAALGTVSAAQTAPERSRQVNTADRTRAAAAPVVSEVLAVQVMLDRAGFSPGEIDGRAGSNLKRALTAFQKAHGLQETGRIDEATWERLSQPGSAHMPLTTYQITDADLAGPFTPDIPGDLVQQSTLQALGYRNAVEKIAERFHASPQLIQSLNPGVAFSAGETISVPNVQPFDPPARENITGRNTGRSARGRNGSAPQSPGAAVGTTGLQQVTIAVSKSTNSLTVEDASGRVLFHAPVTSGSQHDPLPIGNWKVTGIHTMPVFNYNPDLFWDADPAHSKAKIPAGPNNPVGVAWIDLSKEHYGIHGTPEPGRVGHTQSHGCVRLTNWDVARLLQWVSPGTAVVFRE